MPKLTLTETDTELTYAGLEDSSGLTLTIRKPDEYLDVHQIIPIAMSKQSWQDMKTRLDIHL